MEIEKGYYLPLMVEFGGRQILITLLGDVEVIEFYTPVMDLSIKQLTTIKRLHL